MVKTISAGILVKCKNKYVLGHVTGNEHYDIFKGRMESKESYLQTAIRECREESSLVFNGSDLTYLGIGEYTNKKDLAIFLGRNDLINIDDLYCESIMEDDRPEMDYYGLFTYEEMLSKVAKSMKKVLKFYEREIRSF